MKGKPAPKDKGQFQLMSPAERAMWSIVDADKGVCERCGGKGQRVDKIDGVLQILCWDHS